MNDPITRYGYFAVFAFGIALDLTGRFLFTSHQESLHSAGGVVFFGGAIIWMIYNKVRHGQFIPGHRSLLREWFAGGNTTIWLKAQAHARGQLIEPDPNRKITTEDFSRSTLTICTIICAAFALVAIIYAFKVYDLHTSPGSPYWDPHFREQERKAALPIAKSMLFCIAVFIALLYPSLLWKSLTRDWAEKQQDYWARSKRINPVKLAPIVWLATTGASGLSLIILLSNWYEFYSPH